MTPHEYEGVEESFKGLGQAYDKSKTGAFHKVPAPETHNPNRETGLTVNPFQEKNGSPVRMINRTV